MQNTKDRENLGKIQSVYISGWGHLICIETRRTIAVDFSLETKQVVRKQENYVNYYKKMQPTQNSPRK